jgi:hypothetical protein
MSVLCGFVCCFVEPAEGEDQLGPDVVWHAHEGYRHQTLPSANSTASAAVRHHNCTPDVRSQVSMPSCDLHSVTVKFPDR